MWFDNWDNLVRIALSSLCIYALIILVLRLTGKRSLAKLNVFDLVVTVALGSILASTMLLKDTALADGFTALAVLAALQFLVSWLSVRVEWFKRLIRSDARLLLHNGHFLEDALSEERVTHDEVLAAIRKQGHGRIEDIAAVVLETDGGFSVVTGGKAEDYSALTPLLCRGRNAKAD